MRMSKQSRLHLPRVPARPGETPDFSYVQLSPAGAVPRPDVNARARDMSSLSRRPGARARRRRAKPSGPWHPHLDAERTAGRPAAHAADAPVRRSHAAHAARRQDFLLHSLPRARKRCRWRRAWRCVPATCCFPSYRNQGLQIVRGIALVDLMCQLLVEHPRHVQGTAAAGHVSLASAGNIFSISGNLATQFPQAVGWAMAAAIKGEDQSGGELDRRGQQRRGGFSSRPAVRLRVSGAGDSERGQQSVGHLDLSGLCRRRAALVRGARTRIRHRGNPRRRQRFPGGVRGDAVGGGARAHRRRPDA